MDRQAFSDKNIQQPDEFIFDIEGEDIFLRSEAGDQFSRIVNAKATEALGKTEYCQVDMTGGTGKKLP